MKSAMTNTHEHEMDEIIRESMEKMEFSKRYDSRIATPHGKVLLMPANIARQPKKFTGKGGRWIVCYYYEGIRLWENFSDHKHGGCYYASFLAATDFLMEVTPRLLISGRTFNRIELATKETTADQPGIMLKKKKSGYYEFHVRCGDLPIKIVYIGKEANPDFAYYQKALDRAISIRKKLEKQYYETYRFNPKSNVGVCNCKNCLSVIENSQFLK